MFDAATTMMIFLLSFASSIFPDEETTMLKPEVLLAATAVVAGAVVTLQRTAKRYNASPPPPPRVTGWPVLGSALEFGADCRKFMKKHFRRLESPIFTASIVGKDFHFVDTSYGGFSPEFLFRSRALSFRPMAADAAVHGFGLTRRLVGLFDGREKEFNAVYHGHLLRAAGLTELLQKAYGQFERRVFSDPALYPTEASPSHRHSMPLYKLVRESLFRATLGSVISENIILEGDDASVFLERFQDFDEKLPLLVSKLPSWMFPRAVEGRNNLIERCLALARNDEDNHKTSKLLRERNELFREHGGTSEHDIAVLAYVLVWASVANTMPAGFWLVYNLLRHKATAWKALREEVRDFYRRRESTEGPLTVAEIDGLHGLDSALTETFRIYSESMIARDVMEDFELDLRISSSSPGDDKNTQPPHKYFLRKGSRLAVMMSCLHTDETVFEDPYTFRWDRFRVDPATGKPPRFSKNGRTIPMPVRPFGGGISICPGRKFASYEIKAFVVELLKRYDLELVEPDRPPLQIDAGRVGLGINTPLGDVEVRITPLSLFDDPAGDD